MVMIVLAKENHGENSATTKDNGDKKSVAAEKKNPVKENKVKLRMEVKKDSNSMRSHYCSHLTVKQCDLQVSLCGWVAKREIMAG